MSRGKRTRRSRYYRRCIVEIEHLDDEYTEGIYIRSKREFRELYLSLHDVEPFPDEYGTCYWNMRGIADNGDIVKMSRRKG